MKIGFIGLGNMGSGMCANLVSAGHQVQAFDLSADAVAAAVAAGAMGVSSIAEAVAGCDAVVTMLPAGKHVLSVYFDEDGVAAHAQDGAVFLDCSTIAVEDARAAAEQATAHGFEMVDAPVSGGVAAAAGGTLTFMVGGSETGFARAKPILEAMGKTIVHAGGAGNGQVAKIANNMLLGISMIATCEAFNLAEKLGLDAQTFFDISSKASGQNWSMTSYCPAPGPVPTAPSNRDYEPGFAVDMMLKDLRLASQAADAAEAPTRFGKEALAAYEKLSSDGFGGKDFSVVMKRLSSSEN
ncbi:MAG: 3-hydroxyisobutyrate dehydrogenase [Pseudomonadota bacterium]|nr:3-hydroxyisobutyrate dehydrogenase [Pseudomonadota bacterium]